MTNGKVTQINVNVLHVLPPVKAKVNQIVVNVLHKPLVSGGGQLLRGLGT